MRDERAVFKWRLSAGLALLSLLLLAGSSLAVGETWVVAGSFQSEVASCGDWDNTCSGTTMDDANGDGVHRLSVTGLPAGVYEYKFVESGNWNNARPDGNVAFTADGGEMRWYFDPVGLRIADNANQCVATAVGDWQSNIGGSDWAPDNLRTMMWQEAPGSDWYSFTAVLPAGNWQYKVARDEAWTTSYPDGSNLPLNLTQEATVTFRYNCATNAVEHATDVPPPPPDFVVAGDFQDNWPTSAACGEWNNTCLETGMEDNNADGVYRWVATGIAAGSYNYKVVEFGNWGNSHPQDNVPFTTDGSEVRWYYQTGINNIADSANQCIATAVGSWQDEVGGDEWAPSNLRTMMWQESPGSDWYSFAADLPAGDYAFKVARDEAWTESYPDGDVPFSLTEPGTVTFRYNCATNETQANLPSTGGAGHDNNIFWDDLGHNSRDTVYRTPGGAVETGTAVTVRLRAASGDLTEARVRVWNDRINAQAIIPMTLAADDGAYEWWEATIPASADPTIYYYRFIAIDGTATAYYEDDNSRNGGWGQVFATSPDNSYQLTVFDPAFQTPDWVKNGIMYQIFPERFRDGDSNNNPTAGEFHYDLPGGSIVRSGGTDWHTPICDPRNPAECENIYGHNFYGGDLQGIIDKLDYLQNLGVTIIYLNPIFEAPSNHKYDTTDFSIIDDNFGDLATFQLLASEANARGIRLVLDGVFNHSSSDSIYFDRYGRYAAPDGACESETSTYRDWYYFEPAAPAGTGPCAGDTNYESWFGFDSLPKLDANNEDVRDYFWQGGPAAIARYWMQWADGWRLDVAGDVDPGVTNDPNNDYWEGFRDAVHATNPDAYIVGEEWNIATAWTLGPEWDATMNYQFGSAIMSFWRDTTFIDNDHNSGSSAGTLAPLTPSELDARLKNLEERYPPEALQAMMNLLGSHDTNRALFMLDENTGLQDDTLYDDPNYDWSDAMTRLKGVVLLQMTMPGSPTIYYGDEVGLVGPVTWDGSTWQDDPYNRLPYPWLDESGTPFYTHLQSQASQDAMFSYYQTLTQARLAHPALRIGSFDTLLTDDANNVYAYGRLLPSYADAAVVVVNRATGAQTVSLDVAGYLPVGASFTDVLSGNGYTVAADGSITVNNVPGMSGAVLVLNGVMATPPADITDLTATAAGPTQIDLSWSPSADADEYAVYRSLLSGGGYEQIGTTAGTSYSDTAVQTATEYFYVVVGQNSTSLLASGNSNEASATPSYTIDWAGLQWPPSIDHTISTANATGDIYGQLYINGVTSAPGATPGILAEVGYGDSNDVNDGSWAWTAMSFNVDVGNNDEFVGNLLPDELGTYCYTTRYSGDGGATWFYALNGPDEFNSTCPGPFGVLNVLPSADTTAPAAPTNLAVASTSTSSVSLSWDPHPNVDGDLVGFEVYRQAAGETSFTRVARLANATATSFVDNNVTTGVAYSYYVVAYDTSFNRSGASNTVTAVAEPRLVSVTFTVGVPAYTPGTVFIVGDIAAFGPWNPGLVPMTQVNSTTWTHTVDILDGTVVQYKFTRGSWDTVEAWGEIVGLANRQVTIEYGTTGTQTIDLTATDWGNGPDDTKAVQLWRDPLVTAVSPADGATDVPVTTDVVLSWSLPMDNPTTFSVTGPGGAVAGTFAVNGTEVTFTPDAPLAEGTTYDVEAAEATANGESQQVIFQSSFTTVGGDPVEDPATLIEAMIAQVDELGELGALRPWEVRSLNHQLEKALDDLDANKIDQVVKRLDRFQARLRNIANRFPWRMSEETAMELIEQAQAVMNLVDPVEGIDALIRETEYLSDRGEISSSKIRTLTVPLNQAQRMLDRGLVDKAIDRLVRYQEKVQRFVDIGEFSAEVGQPLIDAAQAEIDALAP